MRCFRTDLTIFGFRPISDVSALSSSSESESEEEEEEEEDEEASVSELELEAEDASESEPESEDADEDELDEEEEETEGADFFFFFLDLSVLEGLVVSFGGAGGSSFFSGSGGFSVTTSVKATFAGGWFETDSAGVGAGADSSEMGGSCAIAGGGRSSGLGAVGKGREGRL